MKKKVIAVLALLLSPLMVSAQETGGKKPHRKSDMPKAEKMSKGKRGPMGGHMPSSISVVGSAKITMKPDVAYITLGAQKEAEKAIDAQKEVNKITANIQAMLKDLNIKDNDIQTIEYSVRGNYQYKDGSSQLKNYTAKQRIKVAVPLGSLNELLEKAALNESNIIDDVHFDKKNKEQSYIKAMNQALENARTLAESMAAQLGVSLGRVRYVEELPLGSNQARPFFSMQKAMMADSAPSISAGEISQEVAVKVSFFIMPNRANAPS